MEAWKPIKSDNRYEVSDLGRIRCLKTQHILKPRMAGKGYSQVCLGARCYRYVHRLVADSFCAAVDGSYQVNHIDGNKRNNIAANLEWVTPAQNARHAYDAGLLDGTVCKNQPDMHPRAKPIEQIQGYEVIAIHKSIRAASRAAGIDYSTIHGVLSGKFNLAGGFFWRYIK